MKFRIRKIQHHHSLMPEILMFIPLSHLTPLLMSSSRGSREYLLAYYRLLTSKEERYLDAEGITLKVPLLPTLFQMFENEFHTTQQIIGSI